MLAHKVNKAKREIVKSVAEKSDIIYKLHEVAGRSKEKKRASL